MDQRSHYYKTIMNVIRATRQIKIGRFKDADYHIKLAHSHAGEHTKQLTSSGQHDEAKKFNEDFGSYFKDLHGLYSEAKKKNKSFFKKSEDEKVKLKRFDELDPKHQNRVSHWFGSKDMALHAYPVHCETGEVVHAPRVSVDEIEDSESAERQPDPSKESDRAKSLAEDATKALKVLKGSRKK